MSAPKRLMVPPVTRSPAPLSTGTLSPVIMLSSTDETPSTITPSTGTRPPGLTITISPGATSAAGTSISAPSRTMIAVSGCRFMSFLIASEVLPLARASKYLPRSTSVMTTADASK